MSSASSLSGSPPPDERTNRPYGGVSMRSRRSNVDYGVRNQLMAKLNARELYGMDIYRWEDDDLSLRQAAAQARLPYDRMTSQELKLFPEMARSQPSCALYLYIRNRTLVLWQLDPLIELTIEAVMKEIPEPYNSDYELVKGIHDYLQRYGYINYGVFHKLTNRMLDRQCNVVVIGAGASGLAAARQLKFFGFNVTILEARPRLGGRVMTHRRPNLPSADLGAMIITGIIGNPLITLVQQNPCNIVRMNPKCPIYDSQGKMVDPRKDDMIQKSFNRILNTISYIVHGKNITEIGEEGKDEGGMPKSRKISLGEAFQLIIDQHEFRVQKRRLNYWKKYEQLCKKLQCIIERVKICRNTIDECFERLRQHGIVNLAEATPETFSISFDESIPQAEFERKLVIRCIRQCMQMALEAHDEADQERRDIEQVLLDFKNMEPSLFSHVFMNNVDKRILDFHLANLEYASGAPINSVALKDWDLDDPYGFAGSHMTVKEGLGSIIERLSTDLDVKLNCIVNEIKYNEQGVSISYSHNMKQESAPSTPRMQNNNGHQKEVFKIQADAVLCTIPLGVLKKTPFLSSRDEEPDHVAIRFDPALPTWKRESIARLGFGSLNKLVLYFDKIFWDPNRSLFGRLNDTSASRGELFLFFSNGDLPILIGLFSGESAAITGQIDEKVILQKAMEALNRIFGNNCPVEPVDYVVTRWHLDRFSRGCYSYMSTSSTAEDYDILARPLHPNDKESATPRVFFAGEHTNRQYPSSVHGAFLSGLREAARIADTFIGPLASSGERLCNEMQSHLDIGSGSARVHIPNQPNVQPLRTLHDPPSRNLQQYENIGAQIPSQPNVQQLPTFQGSNRNLQQYQQQASANSHTTKGPGK